MEASEKPKYDIKKWLVIGLLTLVVGAVLVLMTNRSWVEPRLPLTANHKAEEMLGTTMDNPRQSNADDLIYSTSGVNKASVALYGNLSSMLSLIPGNLTATGYDSSSNGSLITPSISTKSPTIKFIYSATDSYLDMKSLSDFSACKYTNCELRTGFRLEDMKDAQVVLFHFNSIPTKLPDNIPEREKQLWVIYGLESPSYDHNKWVPEVVTKRFNVTATYRRDSDVFFPYGKLVKLKEPNRMEVINYGSNKTKGAFVYISNCGSRGYSRLNLIHELQKFIDVDIFGGCTNNLPCKRKDFTCEERLHSQYRFYLSFENSLCKDYITEKFWNRISSKGIFLPVAMGGLSLDDYSEVAPPHSFLHVYNFTSVKRLGEYLKYLMHDDIAYSSYHTWRQSYVFEPLNSCEFCRLANGNQSFPVHFDLSRWWNSNTCRSF